MRMQYLSLSKFRFGEWRSWLAYVLWEHGVPGSNPGSPTIIKEPERPSLESGDEMNLKLLYGLIYGFLGFIIAALSAAFVYGTSTALLWTFVIEDGEWPRWLLLVLAVLFFVVFIFVNVRVISLGLKKGQVLQEDDEEYRAENFKKAKFFLKLSIITLLVFISFLTFRFGRLLTDRIGLSEQDPQVAQQKYPRLDSLSFRQEGSSVEILVDVFGKATEDYELEVKVVAIGEKEQNLYTFQQDVPLIYDRQQFVFPIVFDDLALKFNKYFSQYVPGSDNKIGVDAVLKVVGHLRKKDLKNVSSAKTPSSISPEKTKEAFVRFFFSCANDLCIVSQFENPSEIPTEKLKK